MSPTSAAAVPGEGELTGEPAVEPAVDGGQVTVRYWASARAAVGVAEEHLGVPDEGIDVAALLARVTHGRGDRVARVVAVCSLLVDETVVHGDRAAQTVVRPGAVVDLLPPFAGG